MGAPSFLPFLEFLASTLVRNAVEIMKEDHVDEIVLETEYDNYAALSLYESLGFIKEKRLYRFYLNGKDAFRLVLTVPPDDAASDDTSASETSTSVSSSRLASRVYPRRQNMYRAIKVSPYTDDEDDEMSSR
ncbi:hypothetical protein D9758_007871 [Tetrapyrgos nigripes]|uniref:N-acetyltransferase domain-containing protein n=1 Tax=Tetrapyrgos nigripes TaxID=182062 RepID=A0A8H5D4G1_9AGAR|nr:hypothetical protein D9758_007871 [Tetrapyrgos nigripes]